MATIRADVSFDNVARIKVVGVGGAGGNAVNRMVRSGLQGVEFIAVNTDAMALENSLAEVRLPIGQKITKGLGAGAKPDVGHAAILEDRLSVAEALQGADMVFITAGMGGGTGTGAAPVVAEIAREMGILSVAVVTRPFLFEGPVRAKNCMAGIEALRKFVDTIIIIHNQKILSVASKQTSVAGAFELADDVLTNAVRGICEIILRHGDIQVDFADVKTVMESGGDALMGSGSSEGESRAVTAAERAIRSPLLDDINISGAAGVLVNITHGSDFGIHEISEVMNYIYEAVGDVNQPNIIFGSGTSADHEGRCSVTVIATGFQKDGRAIFDGQSPLKDVIGHLPPRHTEEQPAIVVAPQEPFVTTQSSQVTNVQPSQTPAVQPSYVAAAQSSPVTSAHGFHSMATSVQPTEAATMTIEAQPKRPEYMAAWADIDLRNDANYEEELASPALMSRSHAHSQMVDPMPQEMLPASTPTKRLAQLDHAIPEEDIDWEAPAFLRNAKF